MSAIPDERFDSLVNRAWALSDKGLLPHDWRVCAFEFVLALLVENEHFPDPLANTAAEPSGECDHLVTRAERGYLEAEVVRTAKAWVKARRARSRQGDVPLAGTEVDTMSPFYDFDRAVNKLIAREGE